MSSVQMDSRLRGNDGGESGVVMGRYTAYPEYKDSGLEWIGQMPTDWKTASLSKLFSIKAGGDLKTEFFSEIKTEQYPYPIYTNANDLGAVYGYTSNSIFTKNAITVSGRGEVGFAAYRDHPFDAIIRLLVLSPFKGHDCRFFTYFINSVIDFRVESSAIGQLSTQQISPYKVAFPVFEEQTQIANFLDHETAKIDTLIEEQQSLIRLLKEKRQAVISHAVTKGLNPQAPMKDSGVEWLEKMPKHWNAGRLTYQVDLLVDGTHHSPESYPEGDYLYITAKNIKEHGFDLSNISYISSSDHKDIYSRCSVKKSDVLYIKDGATAGIATVNDLEEEFSLLSSVALIRPRKHILRSKYLKHHLNASVFKDEMLNRLSGGAMTRFTIDGISRFSILIPPLEEQDEIIELIEDKSLKMDTLIKQAGQAISFMEERRTALISAAVTGKIDVRHWQPASQQKQQPAAEATP
ncbi:restriction endonuclease subunit S [uncultured Endozoicomonas sp.]|uniref:restriction endonuclease subunit S n=1 Tax=uncultured Endozoicomonas sp. TaxID=432652 RepID=UPI002614DBFE|nr:restriction endonuclease subunit S [uncultured Endozoicomonas sp.]